VTLSCLDLVGSYLLMSSLKVIYRRSPRSGTQIDLVIHATHGGEARSRFAIAFSDCVEFRVMDAVNANPFLLEVRDIAGWQNEGVRFLVRDVEEEVFVFKCAGIEVIARKDAGDTGAAALA